VFFARTLRLRGWPWRRSRYRVRASWFGGMEESLAAIRGTGRRRWIRPWPGLPGAAAALVEVAAALMDVTAALMEVAAALVKATAALMEVAAALVKATGRTLLFQMTPDDIGRMMEIVARIPVAPATAKKD